MFSTHPVAFGSSSKRFPNPIRFGPGPTCYVPNIGGVKPNIVGYSFSKADSFKF